MNFTLRINDGAPIKSPMIDVYIYIGLCFLTLVTAYVIFSLFVGSCRLVFARKETDDKKNKNKH